jgi:glycosyltransferase involved in cell wall biosynthesis
MSPDNRPFRTVILVQDLEFGGTQRYAVHLLKHLNRKIFSTEIWILRAGDDMLPFVEESGIRAIYLSNSSWVGPRSLVNLARRLVRERPDILYTLTVVPNIWGRIFGAIVGVPAIVSGYRSLVPKQWERWLWRLSDRIICNAEASKTILTRQFRADPDRVAVTPNGVDTDLFCPGTNSKTKRPSVVSIGRLVKEKDPLNLLEAFRLTALNVPEACFNIIGDGYLRPQVEDFIRSNGLESKIKLVSGTNDVISHLRAAWVFAMASKSESSPNVVVEAMSVGLPVVATNVGGIPELVDVGETGLLAEPANPKELSKALTRLLRNEPERKSMAVKARERAVVHYSLEKMARDTERVLLDAVTRRRRFHKTDLR